MAQNHLLAGQSIWRGCLPLLFLLPLTATGDSEATDSGVLVEPAIEAAGNNNIDGVITDQTITRVGRDFHSGFVGAWRRTGSDGLMNLAIYEKPSARWGSMIWVEKDRIRVFQTFLYPGRGNASLVGAQAAQLVHERVAQFEMEKMLFKNPDLAADEI